MNDHLTPGSLSEPPAGNAVYRYVLPSLFPNNGNTCELKFNINIYTNNYKQIVTGFRVLAVGRAVNSFFGEEGRILSESEFSELKNLQNKK